MNDAVTYFITWTTYGTWLQGDWRGWRKANSGNQLSEPHLANWSRSQLRGQPVRLNAVQRTKVEQVCVKHAQIRGWYIHAINVRSNHVHVVVTSTAPPKKVRDQFKAYATRVLREDDAGLASTKIWTRGGDIEFIDDKEDNLERVVIYVKEAQDRKDRDQKDSPTL